MASPTALSLNLLRRSGYAAGVVERFVQPPGRDGFRVDLFGCIDLVAVKRSESGVLAVQATSLPNMSSRINKAKGKAELRAWVAAGNRWECWGWCKRAARWR